jgi:hypothetical protein
LSSSLDLDARGFRVDLMGTHDSGAAGEGGGCKMADGSHGVDITGDGKGSQAPRESVAPPLLLPVICIMVPAMAGLIKWTDTGFGSALNAWAGMRTVRGKTMESTLHKAAKLLLDFAWSKVKPAQKSRILSNLMQLTSQ